MSGVVGLQLVLAWTVSATALAVGAARAADPPMNALAAATSPVRTDAARGINLKRTWGVEIVGVKPVSSGYMLAFKYLVVDPTKAQLLNDRKTKPYLVDEATGTVLAVPAMENIGELRQGATPQAGRTYFMIFGNPAKLVKPGGRVSIVAGNFRVDGLVVD